MENIPINETEKWERRCSITRAICKPKHQALRIYLFGRCLVSPSGCSTRGRHLWSSGAYIVVGEEARWARSIRRWWMLWWNQQGARMGGHSSEMLWRLHSWDAVHAGVAQVPVIIHCFGLVSTHPEGLLFLEKEVNTICLRWPEWQICVWHPSAVWVSWTKRSIPEVYFIHRVVTKI